MLLVVVAVVLWLAAKNWKSVMPAGKDAVLPSVAAHEEEMDATMPEPQTSAQPGGSINSRLPDMQQKTGAHTQAVRDAMREVE
jgi:hypothetical protein